ncbi:MAG: Eco57I restriction-modification methylase domain-containing protein [Treponema sp.]|nr:Eco57I restriction-modification methylase domain-containing protein [Treponema sp.]
MTISKEAFSKYINDFDFSGLFIDMGWDRDKTVEDIAVDGEQYTLQAAAGKSGFKLFVCKSPRGTVPRYAVRRRIENELNKRYARTLIIFIDSGNSEQVWLLVTRLLHERTKASEVFWGKGQSCELLYQRAAGLVFELDAEGGITIIDVTSLVATVFNQNSEKVTKQFYDRFRQEHTVFLGYIRGIKDELDKEWYASLMLNRLMFCYFIQKKRFLDWNDMYLQDKLAECKQLKGTDNFYGFYRSFLLELFHDELANPKEKRREKKSPVTFGDIPYLNGGLFEVHHLENVYKDISIKDEAFQKIFDFFDEWEWHLDARITASGKDINPDVIGYIFEKYINNRADMGAYYTKEDITDYIGKNTIIPCLLEKIKTYHPTPFAPGGSFWQYLQDSGDEYIYDAVKKGGEGCKTIAEVAIPEDIKIGIDPDKPNLLERRTYWNTPTPETIGLPTEIWRETIVRLKRYFELKRKITHGEITEINDVITYNLNIRRLVQDYLEQTADKEFIRKFYKALTGITILDPTCGSGAFLFAALNILEPLYEVCLRRMEEFYTENPRGNKDFEGPLLPLLNGSHPSRSYYIYKTIILNNLYGVDLMKEAVEIAKLRLFLKLVAEVDPSRRKKNFGLEPLPDIDFNIRSGNTLVGFATEGQLAEVVKNVDGALIYEERVEELKSACKNASASFNHFKKMQMVITSDSFVIRKAKQDYAETIKTLDEKLNRYLADTYGLGTKTQWKSLKEKEQAYKEWKDSHQPFHWFAEFYEIISKGGFDVVIGNPPYVEYTSIKKNYTVKNYLTEKCGNLYAFVIERSMMLLNKKENCGMIVPISLSSTPRMKQLRNILTNTSGDLFISNFADRPGTIFSGVHQKTCIFLKLKGKTKSLYTTNFLHWYKESRENLMNTLLYEHNNISSLNWLKIGNTIEISISTKMKKNKPLFLFMTGGNFSASLNMRMMYWSKCFLNSKSSNEYKIFGFFSKKIRDSFIASLNSNLFFYFWETISDCWHITKQEFKEFSINLDEIIDERLSYLSTELEKDLEAKKSYVGSVQTEYEYYHRKSKPIIDEIDMVLAKHYGFTEEELDFIINYDIKYRMGGELEGVG